MKRRGVSKDDLVAILEMSKLCQTLYLHLTGLGSEDDAGIVAVLEDVYECVARVDPGMEVVPLLERCGWDTRDRDDPRGQPWRGGPPHHPGP